MSENLKLKVGADVTGLQKGMRDSKKAVKDFEGVSTNALGSIGDALGVNTGQVQQLASAIKGLGTNLSSSGNAGVAAFGKILASIGPVGTAIAGLGLGAAVIAFKALNDEAQNFRNTVEGVGAAMQTQAYVETYKQAMHDANAAIGSDTADTLDGIKKTWTVGWGTAKQTFLNTITKSNVGIGGALGGGVGAAIGVATAIPSAIKQSKESAALAEKSAYYAGLMAENLQKQRELIPTIAQYDADIAKYRLEASLETNTTAERQAAYNELVRIANEKFEQKNALAAEYSKLYTAQNALAHNTVEEDQKDYELQAGVIQLQAERDVQLKSFVRLQKSINADAAKGTAIQRETNDEMSRAIDLAKAMIEQQGNSDMRNSNLAGNVSGTVAAIPTVDESQIPTLHTELKLTPVKSDDFEAKVTDVSDEVASLMVDALTSVGESIGNLFADVASGDDAWGNFANSAASALADMAVTVGKIAIAAGVAVLAIKLSFESLNGYAAIAAGVALVALGVAVKSGLSNVANGDYSGSSSVATSSSSYTSSATNNYSKDREVAIEVTGTLKASGDSLVAVINNTGKKKSYAM